MPPYSKRAEWTPEAMATLTTMRLAGATAREISVALGPGFTPGAVGTKALRLDLPAPVQNDWPEDRIERMKALWADGLSAKRVAELMDDGATRASVLGKLDRLGLLKSNRVIPSRKPKAPKVFKEKAKRVTLPPLPMHGNVLTADTKLLKSDVWLALPETTPIPLHDLGEFPRAGHIGKCRWPIGENPTLFCGCATEKTYCAAHAKVAYRPIEKAKK